jgi:predicted SnoaL-like aldol condensation-catalyzing enzyme
MSKTTPEQNKTLVLEAFDALFNERDYAAAERFWSDRYIQHSAHIASGRDGLFDLVRTFPATLRYDNQLVVAEGDYVIAHGRLSSASRTAGSQSIGTCFKTRRPRQSQRVGSRCSGPSFLHNYPGERSMGRRV